jgi:signal transduction histidine kinase
LVYIFIFWLTAVGVLGYIYYNTVSLSEQKLDEFIRLEVREIEREFDEEGIDGTVSLINERVSEGSGWLIALNKADGVRITGNLVARPAGHVKVGTWFDVPVTEKIGQEAIQTMIRAYHVELPGGYELIVGRRIDELREFGAVVRRGFYWGIALVLLYELGGAVLIGRQFQRRVDAITKTSTSIMAGDLTQRMPISGSGDEIDRLSGSLNEMLSQIERLMNGMKEVAGNVAHDLKTPLTRMRAHVEAALRSNSKTEYHSALNHTIAECDNLLHTFNALLSIAQTESGQMREGMAVLDAHKTLADVVELYEPMVDETGGTLKLHAHEKMLVRANRQLLTQAVSNLIENAMKYGKSADNQSTNIKVTGSIEGKTVIITVADQGPGIPVKDRERVRERFVRLDESRSKPGNGLGLSLVSSVMTLHGGRLVLEDNNPGLKAIMQIPLHSPR